MSSRMQQRSECVKYDLSRIGDLFGWFEQERGLDLSLLDAEDVVEWGKPLLEWVEPWVEELEEKGMEQRARLDNWNHHIPEDLETSYAYEVTELQKLRRDYRKAKDFLGFIQSRMDKARAVIRAAEATYFDDPDDRPEDPGYNITHWNGVWTEWDTILDYVLYNQVDPSYCAFLFELIEEKRARREITTYHFAKLGFELAMRLGWDKEIDRMHKLVKKLKGKPNPPGQGEVRLTSLDDRFFGEMQFSENALCDAIDLRTTAAKAGRDVNDYLMDE